jgi:hypothetical protein
MSTKKKGKIPLHRLYDYNPFWSADPHHISSLTYTRDQSYHTDHLASLLSDGHYELNWQDDHYTQKIARPYRTVRPPWDRDDSDIIAEIMGEDQND